MIFELCGYQYWKICWRKLCNCSNWNFIFWHPVLSYRLWIFWNFFSEIYVALINCDITFYIYKDIWKQSKSIIIIAVSINVITNDIFIIISILYIINELPESHKLIFIASFLFLLIAKVHIGKLKSFQLISLLEHEHTHNCSKLYELFCKAVIFKLP